MKNSEILEVKLRNLTFIVILGFIIIGALVIGLYFKDGKKESTTTDNNTTNTTSTTSYDVSKMHEVTPDEAVDLVKSGDFYVLYIGRSNCSVCISTVPNLNKAQEDLGYTTQYIDLLKLMKENYYKDEKTGKTKVDWSKIQKVIKPLTDLITVEGTASGQTGPIGKLFYENGFTPTTVIINNGKVVDGFVGNKSADDIKELVQKYRK